MARKKVIDLQDVAGRTEVDRVGAVRVKDFPEVPLAEQARQILPDIESVIVLVLEVFPEVARLATSHMQVGELSLRNLFNRTMEMVNGRIDWEAYKIVKKLHSLGYRGIPLPAEGAPFDERYVTGIVSYNQTARLAGLGVIGWHSMLLVPDYGPRVRLACVLTNAPLETTAGEPLQNTYCVKCGGACVKVCPAKAIKVPRKNAEYSVDRYACNAYLNAAGGCAECVRVCPVGKKSG